MTSLTSSFWYAAAAALMLGPGTANAQVLANNVLEVVEVTLMPGWREADGTHIAALRISLAPGWKTYWRAPGDGGVPTRFDFSRSGNLDSARVLWPTPEVFRQNGMRSIGYRDEVVVPLELEAASAEADIDLYAHMDFGVCEEVCLPVHLKLDHSFPAAERANVEVISAAVANRPVPAEKAQVQSVECRVTYGKENTTLNVSMVLPKPKGVGEALVIEPSDPSIWVSEPTLTREGDRLSARAILASPTGNDFRVDVDQIRMTVLTTRIGIDIPGC